MILCILDRVLLQVIIIIINKVVGRKEGKRKSRFLNSSLYPATPGVLDVELQLKY